jgi:hypothetical protein
MRKFIVSSLAVVALAAGGFVVYTAQAQTPADAPVCNYQVCPDGDQLCCSEGGVSLYNRAQ